VCVALVFARGPSTGPLPFMETASLIAEAAQPPRDRDAPDRERPPLVPSGPRVTATDEAEPLRAPPAARAPRPRLRLYLEHAALLC
jgi:hypothetical protein